MNTAEEIKVIKTTSKAGEGTHADPNRIITQYWSLDGALLATVDPIISPDVSPSALHC